MSDRDPFNSDNGQQLNRNNQNHNSNRNQQNVTRYPDENTRIGGSGNCGGGGGGGGNGGDYDYQDSRTDQINSRPRRLTNNRTPRDSIAHNNNNNGTRVSISHRNNSKQTTATIVNNNNNNMKGRPGKMNKIPYDAEYDDDNDNGDNNDYEDDDDIGDIEEDDIFDVNNESFSRKSMQTKLPDNRTPLAQITAGVNRNFCNLF
jgi:hypothetical protein